LTFSIKQRSSLALQPNSDGKVFALGEDTSHVKRKASPLLIYDIRCNRVRKKLSCLFKLSFDANELILKNIFAAVSISETDRGSLGPVSLVAFSPVEPSLVAMTGKSKTELIDIRQPTK
jgi:hypothetical protein